MAPFKGAGVRFEEAIGFLRQRLALPPDRWLELLREVDAAAADRSTGMSDALVQDTIAELLAAIDDTLTAGKR
jgi:hypothetical protein